MLPRYGREEMTSVKMEPIQERSGTNLSRTKNVGQSAVCCVDQVEEVDCKQIVAIMEGKENGGSN